MNVCTCNNQLQPHEVRVGVCPPTLVTEHGPMWKRGDGWYEAEDGVAWKVGETEVIVNG